MNDKVEVAKVGRKVGLQGYNRLNLYSDFPEFISPGRTFEARRGRTTTTVTVADFDPDRLLVRFEGVSTPEEATKMTNLVLITTAEESREALELEEGEYFWFDIIGMAVYEEGLLLGQVRDLDDTAGGMLTVAIDEALTRQGAAKELIFPWQEHFIRSVDVAAKRLEVRHTKALLDAL
jgi:16S rRNA processing protein RimM